MGVYIDFKYVFYFLGVFFILAVILFAIISYSLREPYDKLRDSFDKNKEKNDSDDPNHP